MPNVAINGTPVLSNFDIFTAAGHIDRAVAKSFTATADVNGKIIITSATVKDNAKVDGVTITPLNGGPVNQPPTVATGASADAPVSGAISTGLHVLGADDAGEANLKYTGTVAGAPFGGSASFSDTNSNSAKNVTATFTKAGTYNFQVLITDSGGFTTQSTTSVTVAAVASAVVIAPASVSITPAQTKQFTATVNDQFGFALASQPAVTWSVDNLGVGSVSATGLYTAPATSTGTAKVRATVAGTNLTTAASVTVNTTAVAPIQINAGGGATGPFIADTGFTGGTTFSDTHIISTNGVNNPAPQSVYQTERYGNFTYSVPSLTAGSQYSIQLDFAELFWAQANQRLFNASINGSQVLTNFDIYTAAMGKYTAVSRTFTATADNSGKISITFTGVKDNAKVSGIELSKIG